MSSEAANQRSKRQADRVRKKMAEDPKYAKEVRDDWAKSRRRSRAQANARTTESKPTPWEFSKEDQLHWAIDEFTKLSKTHANRKYGLEVFKRLLESKDWEFGDKFDLEFAVTPTPVHILRDVEVMERRGWEIKERERRGMMEEEHTPTQRHSRKRNPSAVSMERSESIKSVVDDMMAKRLPSGAVRYRDSLLDYHDDDFGCDAFIRGWMTLADDPGANVSDPRVRPLSIFSVEGSAKGMKECITFLPVAMNQPNVYVRLDSDGQPFMESIMTPAGHITCPHIDHCGVGSAIVEVLGVKVVFAWAPNLNNLRWMAQRHMVTRPKDLLEAVENMSELRVWVLFRGEGIYIDPGVPHAVISINNSAVSGWDYVDSNWLDDNTVKMRMGWEHDLMRDRKAQDIPFFESIEEIARLHRDQMDLWAQAKEHLSRKLGWIENFLKDIESALNEVLLDE